MKSFIIAAVLGATIGGAAVAATNRTPPSPTVKSYYFHGATIIARPNVRGVTAKPANLNCVEIDCPSGFGKGTKCYQCDDKQIPPKAARTLSRG